MDNQTQKNYIFYVNGMHCKACVILTESELLEMPEVEKAKTNLQTRTVEVTGNFGNKSRQEIAQELSQRLIKYGYTLSVEVEAQATNWADFKIAVPAALGFLVLFILLQKAGLTNFIGSGKVSFGTAFIIGIVASLSTCMAVVGGLVLSMSATFAREGDKIKPQVLFHLGRLAAFFILGGFIGALGSNFQLNAQATFILSLVIGVVLLILGINLLDVFPWAKKLQPTLPNFIGKRAHSVKNLNHELMPLLVGTATFFLPCGFTQSMQIYALTTGNFITGAMIMLVFALGTLPVLSLLSFSSLGIQKKAQSGIFFKAAGLVVIFFAIFNIINSLAAAGIISPVFSF